MSPAAALPEQTKRLLRCVTVGDESVLTRLITGEPPCRLDHRTAVLAQIAALVALEAEATSYAAAVDRAHAAGVEDGDILGTLASVASLVGAARVASALPVLASALGLEQGGFLPAAD